MALNQFDAIIYINLNHRRDREELLLKELEALNVSGDKIYRIEAVHDLLNGHRGCAQSHKKALQISRDNGWKNVLILEDDMSFIKETKEIESTIANFFSSFKEDWDVFFLAANVLKSEETQNKEIKKVTRAQCAHAYAVNRCYFDALIDCFDEALKSMEHDVDFVDSKSKAIDQRWKLLQPLDRWYIGPLLGQQRKSYSDIEHQIRFRIHEDLFNSSMIQEKKKI